MYSYTLMIQLKTLYQKISILPKDKWGLEFKIARPLMTKRFSKENQDFAKIQNLQSAHFAAPNRSKARPYNF